MPANETLKARLFEAHALAVTLKRAHEGDDAVENCAAVIERLLTEALDEVEKGERNEQTA